MIPRRRPPFRAGRVIKSIFSHPNRATVEKVEKAYEQAYRVPHVVLLPSCRAGICWALKATIKQGCRVICPTFTCFVVWEAVARSGGQLYLIDAEENGFLMDYGSVKRAQVGDYAIVLCEIYGYTYDLSKIARATATDSVIRIVDMAMTVPTREHFERLEDGDFAVTSFGAGKCMYAGWGGMGFTHNAKLATRVRQIRDESLVRCNTSLLASRSLKMLALNVMHERFAYGFVRRVKDSKQDMKRHLRHRPGGSASYLNCEKQPSKEWFLPSTYVERNLMLYNLEQAKRYAQHRKTLAQRYQHNLRGISGLVCPELPPDALSHYTIRVNPSVRPLLRNYLLKAGVDTSTIFTFPDSLPKSRFPHTSRISSEVLTLPLNIDLDLSDIDRISESVIRGCSKYS